MRKVVNLRRFVDGTEAGDVRSGRVEEAQDAGSFEDTLRNLRQAPAGRVFGDLAEWVKAAA